MPPRRPAPARTALLLALCSTACAPMPPAVLVPPALRACRAEPPLPPADADDGAFAAWVAEVLFAGRDCRDGLARVVGLLGEDPR